MLNGKSTPPSIGNTMAAEAACTPGMPSSRWVIWRIKLSTPAVVP